jgi:hypothetical protein
MLTIAPAARTLFLRELIDLFDACKEVLPRLQRKNPARRFRTFIYPNCSLRYRPANFRDF